MQNSFVADDFIRLMIMSLQKETGYALARDELVLYRQEFAALHTVEAVIIAPDGLERFSALVEKRAEDSIHEDTRSRVSTTLIIVPAAESEKGMFSFVSGDGYAEELCRIQKKCERLGFLIELVIADFVSGTYTPASGRKVRDKKLAKSLEVFLLSEKLNTEPDEGEELVRSRLLKQRSDYRERNLQAGRIRNVSVFNPAVLLIILNIAIFLIGLYLEASSGTDSLKVIGIQDNSLIRQGELWRLITPMFLHADAAHLFGNMLALLYLGRITLAYYTDREFYMIYFVSGLVGNALSFFFTDYLSLGASGAVMGLGGMLIYRMFFGKYAKTFRMAGNYAAMAIMVIYNLLYGVFVAEANINNFGHFGGFIGGFVVAVVIARLRSRQNKKQED